MSGADDGRQPCPTASHPDVMERMSMLSLRLPARDRREAHRRRCARADAVALPCKVSGVGWRAGLSGGNSGMAADRELALHWGSARAGIEDSGCPARSPALPARSPRVRRCPPTHRHAQRTHAAREAGASTPREVRHADPAASDVPASVRSATRTNGSGRSSGRSGAGSFTKSAGQG